MRGEGAHVIGIHNRVPVYAYCAPTDLRKSFEGLSALVRNEMNRDPISGAYYLFTNRRRTRAKVLHFDGTGLWVYAKRMEKGRFAALWRTTEAKELELTKTELELFVQGSQLVGKVRLKPTLLDQNDLSVRHGVRRRQRREAGRSIAQ